MTTLTQKFEDMRSNQAELHRKFQEQAQSLFKDITKEFFDKNPGITGVVWSQYTPYFNDGDTCVFGVQGATFTNAPADELCNITWGEYEGENDTVWAVDNIEHVLKSDYYKKEADLIRASGGVDVESCTLFSNTIQSEIMSDVMLAMFGDHVKIIATREGFEVEDQDHD